jgi:hypothetical protein
MTGKTGDCLIMAQMFVKRVVIPLLWLIVALSLSS